MNPGYLLFDSSLTLNIVGCVGETVNISLSIVINLNLISKSLFILVELNTLTPVSINVVDVPLNTASPG